jgi:hypothetical protein
MNQAIFNPWAPPFLNGYNQRSQDCHDVDHAYVFPENNTFQVLQANEQLSIDIVLDDSADFTFTAFQWALQNLDIELASTPGFLYRIKDDEGKFIQEGFTYCYATPGTFANPWPMFPSVTYAQGQRIQADLINAFNGPQAVQLVFRGFKRFQRIG